MTQDLGDIRSACHAGDEDALVKAMVAYRAANEEDREQVLTYIKGAMGYVPVVEWRMMPPEHTEDGQDCPQWMLRAAMRNRVSDAEAQHICACAVLSGRYIILKDWPDMQQALVRACLPMLEELSGIYIAATPITARYAHDARRCLALHRLFAEDSAHPGLPSSYRIQGAAATNSVFTRHAEPLSRNEAVVNVQRYHRIASVFTYPAYATYEMWDSALGVKPGTSKRRILTGLGVEVRP